MTTSWPAGSPRVLVTDGWLANSGDGAVSLAMERMLRAQVPGAAVLHAAYQGDLLGAQYPELTFVPPLATLLEIPGASAPPAEWRGGPASRLIDGVDLVVSQGGGFLLEHYRPWQRLLALAKVVELGKPLVLLAQTIGEFRFVRARAALESIVRGAHAVSVRERSSLKRVLALGADPERVFLTSDLAWMLSHAEASVPHTGNGLGVVLTTHEQSSADVDRQSIANAVLADVVARANGAPVTVASTVQGFHAGIYEDDAAVAHVAFDTLPASQQATVSVVDRYLTPGESISLFGGCRAVVSQRLHPALFALGQGVPAALLLSGDKADVLEEPAVRRFVCVTPEDATARRAAIDAALAPDALRGAELLDAIRPITDRAAANAEVLRGALRAVGAPV